MKLISVPDGSLDVANVATIGFFDGLHCGHRYLIDQVKKTAAERGLSSLLITFRRHPREVMQSSYVPKLLSTVEEKCSLIGQTGVDYLAMMDFTPAISEMSAREFMEEILGKRLSVKVLLIGYDHRFGKGRTEGFDDYVAYGKELGIEVIQMREEKSSLGCHVSSTAIRALLEEGRTDEAEISLGRPYEIKGKVVEGFHNGHILGFPTANIDVSDKYKLIPAKGVYAVSVRDEAYPDIIYPGMLNIGTRPTLDNGMNQTVEVHIVGFDGNLYGHSLEVSFHHRIRDEIKFHSKDELSIQLCKDAECVKTWWKSFSAKKQ